MPVAERSPVAQAQAADPDPGSARRGQAGSGAVAAGSPKQETVVKDEWSKTPRNAPCPCGSGKKFKLCHGQ